MEEVNDVGEHSYCLSLFASHHGQLVLSSRPVTASVLDAFNQRDISSFCTYSSLCFSPQGFASFTGKSVVLDTEQGSASSCTGGLR